MPENEFTLGGLIDLEQSSIFMINIEMCMYVQKKTLISNIDYS